MTYRNEISCHNQPPKKWLLQLWIMSPTLFDRRCLGTSRQRRRGALGAALTKPRAKPCASGKRKRKASREKTWKVHGRLHYPLGFDLMPLFQSFLQGNEGWDLWVPEEVFTCSGIQDNLPGIPAFGPACSQSVMSCGTSRRLCPWGHMQATAILWRHGMCITAFSGGAMRKSWHPSTWWQHRRPEIWFHHSCNIRSRWKLHLHKLGWSLQKYSGEKTWKNQLLDCPQGKCGHCVICWFFILYHASLYMFLSGPPQQAPPAKLGKAPLAVLHTNISRVWLSGPWQPNSPICPGFFTGGKASPDCRLAAFAAK